MRAGFSPSQGTSTMVAILSGAQPTPSRPADGPGASQSHPFSFMTLPPEACQF